MRAWRRDLDALVGAPAGAPALALALERGRVAFRRLGPRAGFAAGVSVVHAAPAALPLPDRAIAALTLSFLGERGAAAMRAALLAEVARICAPGAVVVVIDHNRPRRRLAALLAVTAAPRPAGATPAARWRRLAYPTARELRAAGFVVERLRLAAGERVQVVWARRAGSQNLAHQGTKCLPGTSTTTEY